MVLTTARHKQALAAAAAAAALATAVMPVISVPAAASAHARAARAAAGRPQQVSYRGYRFQVPAGWPGIDLPGQPATCVRFDRHAFYLGKPGRASRARAGCRRQPWRTRRRWRRDWPRPPRSRAGPPI
jgi:hypothetical protein